MTATDLAAQLRRLHDDPELLVVVNVWDAITASVVAAQPGCRALATASHSIAASHGYRDGQAIPLDLMITAIGRITDAVDVPVSADLEGGYGDVGTTVRRAIQAGAVGGNLEDEMRPLAEAVSGVDSAIAAGAAEGVPFVLNARTDAFLMAGDRNPDEVLADAVARGRAYLDAGADCIFVPGDLDRSTIERLVAGLGERRLSVIAFPSVPDQATLAQLGVARVSYGPITQRLTLTVLADAAAELLRGGPLPPGIRPLN